MWCNENIRCPYFDGTFRKEKGVYGVGENCRYRVSRQRLIKYYNYEKINEIHCTIRFDFRRMYKC